jgi:hypothetical protein
MPRAALEDLPAEVEAGERTIRLLERGIVPGSLLLKRIESLDQFRNGVPVETEYRSPGSREDQTVQQCVSPSQGRCLRAIGLLDEGHDVLYEAAGPGRQDPAKLRIGLMGRHTQKHQAIRILLHRGERAGDSLGKLLLVRHEVVGRVHEDGRSRVATEDLEQRQQQPDCRSSVVGLNDQILITEIREHLLPPLSMSLRQREDDAVGRDPASGSIDRPAYQGNLAIETAELLRHVATLGVHE